MKDEEFFEQKLMLLTPKKVSNASICMLDKIQHLTPAEQVIGAAALFILVCERFHLENYGNILSRAHNYIFDNSVLRPDFRGLRRYLREIVY